MHLHCNCKSALQCNCIEPAYDGAMPHRAEPNPKRLELIHAIWALIARSGLDSVTLRAVAAEAGVSMGRVQHYFPSKQEMLQQACLAIIEGANERFSANPATTSPRSALRELVRTTLPLDQDQRVGVTVWFAFVARAVQDPAIAGIIRKAWQGTQREVEARLQAARHDGTLAPGVDTRAAAALLPVLLDGLITHLLVGDITPDDALALADSKIDRLIPPPG
jgi:AcrR family transcriptional regulator